MTSSALPKANTFEITDSITKMIRGLPSKTLKKSYWLAFGYFFMDLLLIGLGVWGLVSLYESSLAWPLKLVLTPILSIYLGTAVGGLFIIGHDAGHRSFLKSERWNNFFGHICTSFVLWPFHVWRLDHDQHHNNACHIDKDTSWRPVSPALWKRMPRRTKFIYLFTRRYFFLGSFYTTYALIKEALRIDDASKYSAKQKREIRFSVVLSFICTGFYIFASIWLAGWYGFFFIFLLPFMVFHFLLSTMTYFHHTTPEQQFLDRDSWTRERAQLGGTFLVRYPTFLEFMLHDINWHIGHHVCVGIPHYRLREAHRSLKERYPSAVREYQMSWAHIKAVSQKCHFVKSKTRANLDLSWISYDEAFKKSPSKAPAPSPLKEKRAAEKSL